MAITTLQSMSPAVKKYFNQGLLAVDVPNMIHSLVVNKEKMPRESGTIMRFKGYNRLPAATTPVGSSDADPAPESLVSRFVDAEIKFYMQHVRIEEQCELATEDRVLNSATELLGISMRESEDELTRDVLAATATVINCRNGEEDDIPTEITSQDVYGVSQVLRGNNAAFMTDSIEASKKISTAPVRDAYLAMTSTDAVRDLNNLEGFVNKNNYGNSNMGHSSEEGTLANVRFFVSSLGKKEIAGSVDGADVYSAFVCGRDCASTIKLDGYSSGLDYGAPRGPHFRYATMGWKMSFAGRVTNDSFIANLRFRLAD